MIADRLAPLRARFAERSRGDGEALARTFGEAEPDLALVRSVAHRLAGGGGTMGLPAVSVAAAALEEACDAGDDAVIRRAAADLRAVIDALPPAGTPATG